MQSWRALLLEELNEFCCEFPLRMHPFMHLTNSRSIGEGVSGGVRTWGINHSVVCCYRTMTSDRGLR